MKLLLLFDEFFFKANALPQNLTSFRTNVFLSTQLTTLPNGHLAAQS